MPKLWVVLLCSLGDENIGSVVHITPPQIEKQKDGVTLKHRNKPTYKRKIVWVRVCGWVCGCVCVLFV